MPPVSICLQFDVRYKNWKVAVAKTGKMYLLWTNNVQSLTEFENKYGKQYTEKIKKRSMGTRDLTKVYVILSTKIKDYLFML